MLLSYKEKLMPSLPSLDFGILYQIFWVVIISKVNIITSESLPTKVKILTTEDFDENSR